MIRKKTSVVFVWIVLLIGLLVFIFPFIFMISNSFEKFSFVLPVPPKVIPGEPVLDNYIEVIQKEAIGAYFMNSVVITIGTLFISLFVSSLSAYGFSRMNFPGKEALFSIYLITLMIPGVLNIIPQYLIINQLGGIGSRWGLMLLYIGTAVCGNTFFLRGFFSTVPRELQESVMMDGGSHYTFLFRFMLPLSLPSLATLSILIFQGTWDDFFTARVILGPNRSAHTLPIMVQRLHGTHATEWGLVFAAAVLMLVPVLLIYIIFQKRFVVGVKTSGALKG
jgi:multiple sugar transport system permease protein